MFLPLLFIQAALPVAAALPPQTTLPVRFTHDVSASRVHAGDRVEAKLTAPVIPAEGEMLPAGSLVVGHVVEASRFTPTSVPYAKPQPARLTISFDSIQMHGSSIPLHVVVRAMADPISSRATADPLPTDIDDTHTTTQIGGDQITPWIKAVSSSDGDIVGYLHHGNEYAHLLGSDACDASTTEQSMGIFSASACGLYGMPDDSLESSMAGADAATTLISSRHSPTIFVGSEALLEEVPSTPRQSGE